MNEGISRIVADILEIADIVGMNGDSRSETKLEEIAASLEAAAKPRPYVLSKEQSVGLEEALSAFGGNLFGDTLTVIAQQPSNAALVGLVKRWREDAAHLCQSDDVVIQHVGMARNHDADELEQVLSTKTEAQG